MLKFFRKIRKKFIAQNRVTRYIVYAIGEIFLIVIGILIALQLNNWNERMKLNSEEVKYLKRMRNDLNSDIGYFLNQIKEADTVIRNNENFVIGLWKHQSNIEEAFMLVDNIDARTERLILQNSTFEELKNSGKLSLISNEALRELINEHYRSSQHTISMMNDYNDYTQDLVSDVDFNLFKLHYVWTESLYKDKNLFDFSDWQYLNDPSSEKFKQIENLSTQFIGKHKHEISRCTEIIKNQEYLIKAIDEELQNLTND